MTDVAPAEPGAVVSAQPLFMIRAEVALREFRRWMGIRRLQDHGPRHALPVDGELRGTGAATLPADHAPGPGAGRSVRIRPLCGQRPARRRGLLRLTRRRCASWALAALSASQCRQGGSQAGAWGLKRASARPCGAPATPIAAPARNATPSHWKPAAIHQAKCPTAGKRSMPTGCASQLRPPPRCAA